HQRGRHRRRSARLHPAARRQHEAGSGPGVTMCRVTATRMAIAILVAASLSLRAASAAVAQTSADEAALNWFPPPLLPPGALLGVVSGDPTAPVTTTLELSMPDGWRFPPHYHPSYEHVEIRQGTLLVGMGDRLDPKQTKPLTVGDSATAPAGM